MNLSRFLLKLQILFCWTAGGLLVSCAHFSVRQNMAQVRAGMDKSEVIDLLGSPQRSGRRRGQDEWSYVFCEEHKRMIGLIRFDEGKVMEVIQPVSSSLYDKLQKASNPNEYEKTLELHRRDNEAPDSCP